VKASLRMLATLIQAMKHRELRGMTAAGRKALLVEGESASLFWASIPQVPVLASVPLAISAAWNMAKVMCK